MVRTSSCVNTVRLSFQVWFAELELVSSSLAGKLADLTKAIDAALLKGIIFRCCSETFSVPPTHSFVCFVIYAETFPLSRWEWVNDWTSVCTFFLSFFLSFLFYQESFKLPRRCSPKWNTMQTLRRKWRKNLVNSCNSSSYLMSLYLIFLATFKKFCTQAHKLLYICHGIM